MRAIDSLQECLIGGRSAQGLVSRVSPLIMMIHSSMRLSCGVFRQVAIREEVGQGGDLASASYWPERIIRLTHNIVKDPTVERPSMCVRLGVSQLRQNNP